MHRVDALFDQFIEPNHPSSLESLMSKALFFHAGCPVCVAAEQQVVDAIDRSKYAVEVVHLGESRQRIDEAERLGVRSVPALVLDGAAFHINFGASLADVKGAA
jgi:glutaredoxin 3